MNELNPVFEEEGKDHRVFSIGHSNVSLERFALLLQVNDIEVLVDVRSRPYSRWASQFNHDTLKGTLESKEIKYHYLGRALGGRPDSEEFYDAEGHVLYSVLAETDSFQRGIGDLARLAEQRRVVIMCSEEDPSACHRRLLVGRVLEQQGFMVKHIRGNGHIEEEYQLRQAEQKGGVQLSLLPMEEDSRWRSVKPIRSDLPDGELQTSLEP